MSYSHSWLITMSVTRITRRVPLMEHTWLLYHGESNLHFNEMIMIMMMSALYQTTTLIWIFIMRAHCNNRLRIDMLLHSHTLFWFRANQSFVLLISAMCLAEKQKNICLIVFGLTRLALEPKIYRIRGKHVNHNTTNAVLKVGRHVKIYLLSISCS
jgi:hypothetical protein